MKQKGYTIAAIGRLRGMTHKALAQYVEERGARFVTTLSEGVDYVVQGAHPGSKLERVKELGIECITKEELSAILDFGLIEPLEQFTTCEDAMAQLRGQLNAPPSRPGWQALCHLFAQWPEEEGLAVGLEYAIEHMAQQRWPAELRVVPPLWLQQLLQGQRDPRHRLARALHFQSGTLGELPLQGQSPPTVHAPICDEGLARLCALDALRHIEILSLPSQRLTSAGIEALAAFDGMPQLRALHLEDNPYTDKAMEALLKAPWLEQLEALSIQSPRLSLNGIRQLQQSPKAQRIEQLIVTPSIRETLWAGEDSDRDHYEMYFYEDNHFRYSNEGGAWDTPEDKWRQVGRDVVMSMTDGYAVHTGTIQQDKMSGVAKNIAGGGWNWSFRSDAKEPGNLANGWGLFGSS